MPEVSAEAWDRYVGDLQSALQASSGLQRMQIEAQIDDAKQGRANAMKIAQLQAETSRYGIDAQRATAMAQLKENARQFEMTHALDLKKFGLAYADTATDYLSSPDRYFQAADFMNMASRYAAGQPGVAPYGATGTPTPKTQADFAVLAEGPGGGTADAQRSNAAQAGGAAPAGSGGATVMSAAAAGGAGGDARVKALKAMIDAVPPSGVEGLDGNDFAVMQAAKALYSTNLRPGTLENLRPGQLGILQSAGARLGYDPKEWLANQRRSGVGQGSARVA